MSPRTKKQLSKLKAQRREQIIKESLQLFADKGYFNTSISDIATKLKIAKGLLYNYFSSKEEIYSEIVEDVSKNLKQIINQADKAAESASDFVKTYTSSLFNYCLSNKEAFKLFVREIVPFTTDLFVLNREKIVRRHNSHRNILIKRFSEGIKQKEFRGSDPDKTVSLYQHLVFPYILYLIECPKKDLNEESEIDFVLLKYVGDNPLFGLDELSTLIASSSTGRPLFTRSKTKERAARCFNLLLEKGLVENAAAPLAGIKPSGLGLEVLAGYWGVSQESMKRFQSWPQKQSRNIGTTYSEGALSHIGDHTRLVQQFVFGLLDNAWRLQEEHGGVDVYLDTLVGKPIYFQDLASGKIDWSIPDALIELGFWRRTWRDGHVHDPKITFAEARVHLEVDRATNPIHRLSNRMKKYGRIWRGLSGNPVQVWIIDGTPWREKEILEMLEDAGINGWTVLFERLVLKKEDPWWDRFSHKEGILGYSKHRGMAPLRKIWRKVGDYKMHHFLDHKPWEGKMSQSKPLVKGPRGY